MENTNKNLWIGLAVVLVVVVGLVFWSMNSSTPALAPGVNNNPAANNTSLDANLGTEDVSAGSVNTGSPAVSISYTNALVKYADKRIQFDTICQAHPNTVTYKDNTGIMLDNRSPVARTIKVGTNYAVKAWGFKIIILPDVYFKAKTLLVDCDKSQNVATILVQE